ncbi:gluconokinase [Nocardioides seonyuensis]|nr:gluconokinase [Nocardioides seonyuensis]
MEATRPSHDSVSSMPTRHHLVFMGVSGTGKSAVGRPASEALGLTFAEGDDFHPQANIDKMSRGVPLTDEDRWPWLRLLAAWTRERAARGEGTGLACSALRRVYRDVLREAAPDTVFVHFTGSRETLEKRMGAREHFMPTDLLDSQLATLEHLGPDERGIVVDIEDPIDQIVDDLVSRVRAGSI